jgi:hypothetical protein
MSSARNLANEGDKTMQDLVPPVHPLPPGGHMPDLNLAGCDGFDVARSQCVQGQPDPIRPALYVPTLSGSPEMGGIDPARPVPDLNLAGADGVPSPTQLAGSVADNGVRLPDFDQPDYRQPELKPAGMMKSAISFDQQAEFASDPLLPDLTAYHRPHGLDIHTLPANGNGMLQPDPLLADLLAYDVPSGATVYRGLLASDPLLPHLQQPQVTQEVEMQGRPGDLDPHALQQLHVQPLYQQLGGIPYNQIFMDQSGVNSTQRRHNDLLMGGLDSI